MQTILLLLLFMSTSAFLDPKHLLYSYFINCSYLLFLHLKPNNFTSVPSFRSQKLFVHCNFYKSTLSFDNHFWIFYKYCSFKNHKNNSFWSSFSWFFAGFNNIKCNFNIYGGNFILSFFLYYNHVQMRINLFMHVFCKFIQNEKKKKNEEKSEKP